MKELSIFVDESGDFGEYERHSPYYIISIVVHEQAKDIDKELIWLESELTSIGWPMHCVHAGPVIRSEEEYRGIELKYRQNKNTIISFQCSIRIWKNEDVCNYIVQYIQNMLSEVYQDSYRWEPRRGQLTVRRVMPAPLVDKFPIPGCRG